MAMHMGPYAWGAQAEIMVRATHFTYRMAVVQCTCTIHNTVQRRDIRSQVGLG